MEKFEKSFELGGKQINLQNGIIARQAGGAIMLNVEGLTLLCCATCSREPREGIDFFPLMCDYEERFYAAGKFPGGFIKREGRPSDTAVLTCRKIDRTIRPTFPDDFKNEVQVIITALSQDNETIPDVYAITGASFALAISNVPYPMPIAAVRIGRDSEGKFIVNPTFAELETSDLNLIVSGTKDRVNMLEDESKELSVEVMAEAISFGHDEVKKLCAVIGELQAAIGKQKMDYPVAPELEDSIKDAIKVIAQPLIEAAIPADGKEDLFAKLDDIKKTTFEQLSESFEDADVKQVKNYVGKLVKIYARQQTMAGVRIDGRGFDEIRELHGLVGFLPRVHGSAMFTRGQTQVISCVTLGSGRDRQRIDTVNYQGFKRYIHHYNFPPYSVGEVRFMRGAGRREIGHGYLAEKALEPVLPNEDDFAYTMRVVSETTESNASSSMAATCGSTMALMAAGVPLKRMVGGIGIGIVNEGDDYKLLKDLSGFEDFNGDMDFKVTGTSEGITAIQLDVKFEGLTMQMVLETLKMAEGGYLEIIESMKQVIPEPSAEISQYAPLLELVQIDIDQIGTLIGPSGKTIKKICADTGAEIDIDEDGKVYVSGTDHEGVSKALSIIRAMTTSIEKGNEYTGTVVRIMPFGAFIELVPGRDGLLHISNIAERRIDRVEDVLNLGDSVPVKVREVDEQGKINLIRTDIAPPPPRRDRDGGGGRDGGRGGRDGGRGGGRDGGRGGGDRGGRGGRSGGRDGGRDHGYSD